MKRIRFELVHSETGRKYYKCSELLTKTANKFDMQKNILVPFIGKVYDEYVKYVNPNGLEYVCVSDAHTHIERLVFPAFKLEDTFVIDHLHIAGVMTTIDEGGDSNEVYEPSYYFKQLAEANGYEYESDSH